ncbi:MAG: hypothetical protein KA128_11120 [Zoogloea sp.]|nr:hypothetical protein [Zoogloea sp.]
MLERNRNPDGTYDGAGVMADLTGLSRQSMADLAAEVKANSERLSACPYHEFAPVQPMAPLRQRYRCIECGGEIDRHAWYWFQQGRRAAPVPAVPL